MRVKKTIGIIGGMGPAATVDLFHKIVANTDAKSDSDHIHILIDNYPQVPDRTCAIKQRTNEPVKYILEAASRLEAAGADFLIIPCNTSHYFYEEICAAVSIPIVNMIEETARWICEKGYKTIGLFATDGVLFSGIYEIYFAKYGIQLVLPDSKGQEKVMHLIYNEIKAGKVPNSNELNDEMVRMKACGAEAFVLGCTELPIAFQNRNDEIFIDATEILARVAIEKAGYDLKASDAEGK